MNRLVCALGGALSLFLVGCASLSKLPYSTPSGLAQARTYLLEHHQTPVDYVVSKFEDHDLVFLGEFHRLRHDPLLVQKLLPALSARGVKNLVIEFANYADQGRIDKLVTDPQYDETLARSLCLNSLLSIGIGGYQEYCDIFKAAWAVNQSLREGEPRFRVLGVNNDNDWSVLVRPEDARDETLRLQAFRGQTERDWAERVLTEVIAKQEKALVYCGSHHAFTKYRQSSAGQGRFGNVLFDQLGSRTFNIFLHSPWFPSEGGYDAPQLSLPCDGAMDFLLASLPPEKRSFGVDVAQTPLGEFPGTTSVYSRGYEDFTLADFCDGYICQGLLTDYEPVTPIPDFVNASNLALVRRGFPNPWFRTASASDFNGAIRHDADVYRRIFREGLSDANRIYASSSQVE